MNRTKQLKIHLSLAILILIAVLISGFFIFSPVSIQQIAQAVNGDYNKPADGQLTAADWNLLDEDFLDKQDPAGDSMAGPLTLPGLPTLPNHAATMQYVDDNAGSGDFVQRTGDTMTGLLTLSGDPTANMHAATRQYVDNSISSADFVSRSGDSMTGLLTLSGDPTANMHAATRQYADGIITNSSGQPLQMVCGNTTTGWIDTIQPDTVYIDTNPGLGWSEAYYLSRIAGGTLHYRTYGASNPYSLGGDAFRVYIVDPDGSLTAADAIAANWIIQWCVVGR